MHAGEIIGAPTVRETDGLAMSSRNQYLSAAERALAPAIYATLQAGAYSACAPATPTYASIERAGWRRSRRPASASTTSAVRDAADLQPRQPAGELVVLAAARLGKARLIDNLRIERRLGDRARPPCRSSAQSHVFAHQRGRVLARAPRSAARTSGECGALPSATAMLRDQRS